MGRVIPRIITFRQRDSQSFLHIPAVLLVEGVPVVLRMTGDKDLPPIPPGRNIQTCLGGIRQNLQTRTAGDLRQFHCGVPGMGGQKNLVKAAGERVVGLESAVAENAKEFFPQGLLLDAVVPPKPRLGAPADVQSAVDMGFAPVQDVGQLLPVVHLLEGQLLHRSPCDN